MKNYQKLTILYYLNRKKATADAKAPIYVRITIDGNKREFSLGFKCAIEHWSNKTKRVCALAMDAPVINAQILKSEVELKQRFWELQVMNDYVTSEMLKNAYFRKRIIERNKDFDMQNTYHFSAVVDGLLFEFFDLLKKEKRVQKIKNNNARTVAMNQLLSARLHLLRKTEEHIKKGERQFNDNEIAKTLLNATDFLLIDFLRKVLMKQRASSTLVRWKMTKVKIQNFLWQSFQKIDLPLGQLKYRFAERLFEHLTTKDACGSNAAMKHIKNVKQIIDLAVNNDWITKNPIGNYKCTYIESDREELSMNDIKKLLNQNLSLKLDMVRDAFLFCCFTGYAYEDARRLTKDDIITDLGSGERWIMGKRSKTNEEEEVPILPLAGQIIEKYKDHPARVINGYLIPTYSNQYYNGQLREIAAVCGIQKSLTSHIARYTFAVTITLENDVPLNVVGKMMGHRSIRATEKYAKVTRKNISDNMSVLSQKLFSGDGTLKL